MESVVQYFLAAPFFILLIAFITPRKHRWFVYLFIFLTASLFALVTFWGVQEMEISNIFSLQTHFRSTGGRDFAPATRSGSAENAKKVSRSIGVN